MLRTISLLLLWALPFVSLRSQVRPDSTPRRAPADTAKPRVPQVLAPVQVRASRRRVPNLRAGHSDNVSRSEAPSFELFDPLTQGQLGAIFRVSPEFVITAGGEFSLMGGPASSNQLTLGGVRMPAGLVTGDVRPMIATSPWDVSTGGAAGATAAIVLQPASKYGDTFLLLRGGASGIVGGGAQAPAGLNTPLQGTLSLSRTLGRLGARVNGFVSQDAVALRRWDTALAPVSRSLLDSLAQLTAAPIVPGAQRNTQVGVLSRFDLMKRDGSPRDSATDFVSIALTRTTTDGGLAGRFSTGSTGTTSAADLGVLQYERQHIARGKFRLAHVLSGSTGTMSVERRTDGPLIAFSDSALGGVVLTGGAAPQPTTRHHAIEGRSQATWFSATNTRRYLLQLQARHEALTVGGVAAQSWFTAASPEAVRLGTALSMDRVAATSETRAAAFVLAPAASVGFDLGRRGSMLLGVRADAWRASDVLRDGVLHGIDLSPRIGLVQRVGRNGTWGTVRSGVGRFVDWPSLDQWAPGWASGGNAITSCIGSAVPPIDVTQSAPACDGPTNVVTTGRVLAAPSLQPVSSVRADLALAINALTRYLRADIGLALARYDRVQTFQSPYTGAPVLDRLDGEQGRVLLVPAQTITTDGVVGRAPLSGSTNVRLLDAGGRSTGTQYRLRLATRDPWARLQLEANYAWNGGTQRTATQAPSFTTPALITMPASGNRHTISASLGSWVALAQIRATLIVRSGLRFTPLADRDLNGDGAANDAVFVPRDLAGAWAAAVPGSLRGCVERAAGRVITPNACAGPWSIASNVFAKVPGTYLGLPRRTEVELQLSNPTSLFASLAWGDNLSFGGSAFVDPRLLRVTGYSSATRQFTGEVLRGFGRPIGMARTITDPARLAVSVRIPLGRSSLARRVDESMRMLSTDTSLASREKVAERVIATLPNIPEIFLSIRSLDLTAAQRGLVQALQAQWASATPRAIAGIAPSRPTDLPARRALLAARTRAIEEYMRIVVALRGVLTPEQVAGLDPNVGMMLNLRAFRWIEVSPYPL